MHAVWLTSILNVDTNMNKMKDFFTKYQFIPYLVLCRHKGLTIIQINAELTMYHGILTILQTMKPYCLFVHIIIFFTRGVIL